MFHTRVGEAVRLRASYIEAKVGKAGLTVTLDYTDESGNATTGLSAGAGAIAGEYYYVLTPDAAGVWYLCFKTATATVDQQHLPGVLIVEAALTTARAALLDNLNATVASRSSHSAADVWLSGARTLTSFGTLVADVAAAVWASGARTLTSFGTLVADTATAVWAKLTSALTTAGSIGALAVERLGMITGGAQIVVTSPVADDDSVTTYQGDDYFSAESRALVWANAAWPDFTGAAITLVIKGALTGSFDYTNTAAVGGNHNVTLELARTVTETLLVGKHLYSLVIRRGGHDETRVDGTWTSTERRAP